MALRRGYKNLSAIDYRVRSVQNAGALNSTQTSYYHFDASGCSRGFQTDMSRKNINKTQTESTIDILIKWRIRISETVLSTSALNAFDIFFQWKRCFCNGYASKTIADQVEIVLSNLLKPMNSYRLISIPPASPIRPKKPRRLEFVNGTTIDFVLDELPC